MSKKIGAPFNSIFSWYIKKRIHQIELFKKYPFEVQQETLLRLLKKAKNTEIGKAYDYQSIHSISDFKNRIPLQKYEDIYPFIKRSINGEKNILWPSPIKWYAKSSGTTTGKSKFIPVSKEALEECHYKGGKDLLALYYVNYPETKLFKGKHLIIGGSSTINYLNKDSYFGDLSAIIVKNLPWWCEWRRTPNKKITLIPEWEEKIAKLASTTIHEDVYILAGVPSWTLILLEYILKENNVKNILEIWPNLELYMHGGVNFEPYKQQFNNLIPKKEMNYVQTYNASEGFFGIQDLKNSSNMLLMLDYGVFYEFVPINELQKEQPKTLTINEVKTNEQYALVISSNAGLWRYLIGDTIKFTSVNPFRFEITGRTKHFINAFGEELIIENTDTAIIIAAEKTNTIVLEYTVAPIFMNKNSGAHEWLIEFEVVPENINAFIEVLDLTLKNLNSDYEAKRSKNLILNLPVIRPLKKGMFYGWLKSKGKLGGQNKVPRLSNNREYVDEIIEYANNHY
jgi:hypothetical protein